MNGLFYLAQIIAFFSCNYVVCRTYHIPVSDFGANLREVRERYYATDRSYSVRKVAIRIGIEPSYLSKIERGEHSPPSEKIIVSLAREMDLDADVLLAKAGKIRRDVKEIILKRPKVLPALIRGLKRKPNRILLGMAGK